MVGDTDLGTSNVVMENLLIPERNLGKRETIHKEFTQFGLSISVFTSSCIECAYVAL